MDSPLVSVIVPSFNQSEYLPAALDSVMFQDYPNIELIICNHGSTDNTSYVIRDYVDNVESEYVSYLSLLDESNGKPEFLRKEAPRYPSGRKITVLESDENIGATSSYNEGFRNATGEYCIYLVGDDYLMPCALSEMVYVLEKDDVDFVYADMHVVDDNGRILQRFAKPEYSFQACFCDWFHLGVCRLYRRSLHDISGYYNPEYIHANDYDMFLRFAMDGARFKHLPKVLYSVRKHFPEKGGEPAAWRNNGYQNLLDESVRCARRAIDFINTSKSAG